MIGPTIVFPSPVSPSARFALWQAPEPNARKDLTTELGGSRARCRWPHHTSSVEGLMGFLQPLPSGSLGPALWKLYPGEILLAGSGVLVLEDLPEFRREAIEQVAKAWRDGFVQLEARRGGLTLQVPVRCSIYATAELCPCGAKGCEDGRTCGCTPEALTRWLKRINFALHAFQGRLAVQP